jgi:apolipoprotein N-acyltransferase
VLGAAAVAGYAPLDFHPLTVLSLAGLALLWARAATARRAFAIGYAWGLGLFLAGVSWVYVSLHDYGGMPMPLAAFFTLLFCAFLALYPALAGALAVRIGRTPGVRLLLLFPALWALSEWVRGWFLSGFPWLAAGYSQVPQGPFAGYAPLVGVFGVSLAACVAAGAAAWALDAWLDRSRDARLRRRAVVAGLLLAGAVTGAGVGLRFLEWTEPESSTPVRVALLQGNIPQELKWRPERARATLETYLQMVRATDAELVLLPETALPMLNVDVPPDYLSALGAHVARRGGDALVGVPELDPSGRYYNSVMSFGSSPAQTYRKHHLVPFGDYFPLRPVLGWVMEILHIPMSDFSHGEAVQAPLRVAGQKVAVNICYEDAFGEEVIRQLPEATLLANFTNDAWWGDSLASGQHLQIAQMRALESGRPMLRATNTGVTAIIDHRGHIAASAPGFANEIVRGEVLGRRGATPYVSWGNYGFLALSALMIGGALLARRGARH